MINIKFLSLLLLGFLFVISCSKDGNLEDKESPVISLNTPSASMYMAGDTLYINATISDNDELHEITAKIDRTTNGTTEQVWSFDTHSHTAAYTLDQFYVVEALGMHNDFKLTITVSDHNENVSTKEFSFHVM